MVIAITEAVEDGLRAAGRGATHLIYRPRGDTVTAQLEALRRLVAEAGLPVLAHSRADLALASGSAGLHLPAADIPVPDARLLLDPPMLVGRSTHDTAQVARAGAEGADYVLFGPVFETPSHPGHPGLGLAALREASASSAVAVVAIGGIDRTRAEACLASGAAGYAAIRLFRI